MFLPKDPFNVIIGGVGGQGNGLASQIHGKTTLVDGPLEMIPTLVSVPPSQNKVFGNYVVGLRQKSLPAVMVVTEFGLTDVRSGGGIAYKGLSLKAGKRLTYKEARDARAVAAAFKAQMDRLGVAPQDVTEEPEPPDGTIIDVHGEEVPY